MASLSHSWAAAKAGPVTAPTARLLFAFCSNSTDRRSALPCAGRPADEQAKEVGELLLRRGLLRRCDHLYKKPPPGKKLAKYPRKLVFFNTAEALVRNCDGGLWESSDMRGNPGWPDWCWRPPGSTASGHFPCRTHERNRF